MLEAIITGVISGVISGMVIAIIQYFLIRWLDKRMREMLEKKGFESTMKQMKEYYKKKEKEVQEAGGSMADWFQLMWEDSKNKTKK